MSLPPLLRYVYNHGTEEVIKRGKKIFHTAGVQISDADYLLEQVRFRVRNDVYQNFYTVTVNKYLDPKQLSVRCQCPYNMGDICRHEVAALFQLNDMVASGLLENTDVEFNQKHTVVRMRHVSLQMLRILSSPEIIEQAELWAAEPRAIITNNKNDSIEAEVPDGDHTYKVILRQNSERYFDTSCGCNEKRHPICVHKAALFLQVLNTFGSQYFQGMLNWDEQKNKLLQQYGYSLNDDLTGKFTFTYENGKPFLRVLDPTIKKVSTATKEPYVSPVTTVTAKTKSPQETITSTIEEEKRLGIVLDTNVSWYPFVHILLASGSTDEDAKEFIDGIEIPDLQQYVNPLPYNKDDREMIPAVRKFAPHEIMKYLKKNLPFGDLLDDHTQVLKEHPTEEVQEQVWEYLVPKYKKMLERYRNHTLCFINNDKRITSRTITPVEFDAAPVEPQLSVHKEGDGYVIYLNWIINDNMVDYSDARHINAALLEHEYKIYSLHDINDVLLVEKFMPDGKMVISAADWPAFLEGHVTEWAKRMHVHFDEVLVQHAPRTKPFYRLYLQEREQMLVLRPAFLYGHAEVGWDIMGDIVRPDGGVVSIIHRDEQAEQEFLHLLRTIHSDIQQNTRDHYFFLPAKDVLAQNWFFRFMEVMKEWNVEVFGFEGLKNLRINTHKPETKVRISSGIDWFDASVEISFGSEVVTISEVKKALAQKQNFVKLSDGSVGLLPDEWLKKYSLLVKMGEQKDGKLRIKKVHFSVLDELLAEMDEDALLEELEAKKEKLTHIITNDYSAVSIPSNLTATLRPYQIAGFQWLVFLKEAGWGGILADDMGLGKTVQTLAFFLHYKKENPEAKFLVICPTTLMYNWEKEIRKFSPDFSHHIHHGPKRGHDIEEMSSYDIVITTYGTMRSDIKFFKEIHFDYAVLDESQSIKNPQSQVAKASLLLNTKYRLALSGTPVQNNTFDLYAQMNFLNPGMLGSREFFMNEFATPIDKFQEAEVKQQLRKLTYPFLLRRTKEQVAKDLPEKTEMILYCDMGKEQRKVYEAYRQSYKDQIMGMIDERGIDRSRMHVLQGLTKLRQICDSPAILNEEDKFANHSVKLDELLREIKEYVGNHKALVFSQFLGMLGLIRQALEKEGIPYAYFDGSTSSTDREKAIEYFQNDDSCRVFLISLKAGGIGLNLTAADYVYIVDPWWNPAVEQQAIDRTHRIGQTKNIFAYRMICRDTIEEKMLQLQERKRALASELISDDNAILKRLTKEDIAFLFS